MSTNARAVQEFWINVQNSCTRNLFQSDIQNIKNIFYSQARSSVTPQEAINEFIIRKLNRW